MTQPPLTASGSQALIVAFGVPPDADDAFVAAWREAAVAGAGALHRALRADVDLRFVAVAGAESARAWEEARERLPFAAHAGLYEIVRAAGTPDVAGGALLIDPFEVPDGEEARFLAGWERARDALARQRGYLGTRLHRSLGPAAFRFVDLTRWSSPLMFARALRQPECADAARALPFASHAALYQPVD